MSAAPHLEQPVPFRIFEGADGVKVASNGTARITVLDDGGRLQLRRAIKGLALKPPAELLIPALNGLTTELLATPEMPAEAAVGRLLQIVGMVPLTKPRNVEWAMATLGDVHVYTDGVDVIVTRAELTP